MALLILFEGLAAGLKTEGGRYSCQYGDYYFQDFAPKVVGCFFVFHDA